jgi:CBS domain-containing protein
MRGAASSRACKIQFHNGGTPSAARNLHLGEAVQSPGGVAMRCKDIMNADVECVSARTSVREAAQKMRDRNVGFLPVCDESMRAIGAVTDRDIAIRVVAEENKLSLPVESIMSLDVVSCFPDDDLGFARELMAQHHKSRIMCVNREGRLEGVISLSDIAQFDASAGAETLRQVSDREARSSFWAAANSDRV